MIEISLYGHKSSVLGWIELFEQEKIPYKFKGEKQINPSQINVIVNDRCDLAKQNGIIIIHEPESLCSSKGKNTAVINSFTDTNNDTVNILSTHTKLRRINGRYAGEYKTHTAFNDEIFSVVDIKKQVLRFNFNMSGQLNSYGFTQREVQSGIKDLEISLQIAPYDRAGILRFLKQILLLAFCEADIPYVHLWYYPGVAPTVFLFRQDVDYVHVKGIEKLLKITAKHNIKGTYFINIDGGEEYEEKGEMENRNPMPLPVTPMRANHLKELLTYGNEFANHGFLHTVYDDYISNKKDLKRCNDFINKLFKVCSVGYASPGGIYTRSLGKALSTLKFSYSSNLILGSGGFPYNLNGGKGTSKVLEIPFYLICDACFDPFVDKVWQNKLAQEFIRYIDQQIIRNEPVNIMGHPHFSGRIADTFYDKIFTKINLLGIKNMAMKDYAKFWKKRINKKFAYTFDAGVVKINSKDKNIVVSINYKSKNKLVEVSGHGFEIKL